MALQVAKIFGGEVTAVTSSRNSERIMNDFEPDHIIDYTKNNFIESNNTYDVIFDVQGNKSFNEVFDMANETGLNVKTQPNIYNSIDFAKSFLSRKQFKKWLK